MSRNVTYIALQTHDSNLKIEMKIKIFKAPYSNQCAREIFNLVCNNHNIICHDSCWIFLALNHQVWELSDNGAKGYLDRQGFFCALKLIALVQSGQEATLGNLASSTPPPNLVSRHTVMGTDIHGRKWYNSSLKWIYICARRYEKRARYAMFFLIIRT